MTGIVPDARPLIVAIAGPNGAGKTTFFHAHLREAGLRFVNADEIARELNLPPYEAAAVAGSLREEMIKHRESFVFETVFSDPAGEKLAFLTDAAEAGYNVTLCFIGIPGWETSEERVAMRVLKGGHDVPTEKLASRYPRTIENLAAAIPRLPAVLVYDNGNFPVPFRKVAEFQNGKRAFAARSIPGWLKGMV